MKHLSTHPLPLALAAAVLAACARPPTETRREAPTVGYGATMAEVGRRFEQAGRAGAAGRFELAAYQVGELEEIFREELPRASPPHEGHPEVLPPMASAFTRTTLPDLRRGAASRDRAAFAAAFGRAAAACNGCHVASGHGFIEVPVAAGQAVPNVDPLPSPAP